MTAALQVLGFMELPKDEVPGEDIWHHSQRLEEWFEAVEHRRKNGGTYESIDDPADMTENELARELRGG